MAGSDDADDDDGGVGGADGVTLKITLFLIFPPFSLHEGKLFPPRSSFMITKGTCWESIDWD